MSGGVIKLRTFVADMTELVQRNSSEPELMAAAKPILRDLIARDDWLPAEFSAADVGKYRQYLLHCDPLQRFSIVSFVWGPGQKTPIHDHTVWGLIGMLRGAEIAQRFDRKSGEHAWQPVDSPAILEPGEIDAVSPRIGDVHQVVNALQDRASISIHVYGANIGSITRHTFDPVSGAARNFVSGYSSRVLPNVWAPES